MIDEWFYKAFGEEHGPVSFERLQEMALKNQLSPQDRVRSAEWKEWVAARTVPQLFPKHRLEAEPEAVEEIDDSDFRQHRIGRRQGRTRTGQPGRLGHSGVRGAQRPPKFPAGWMLTAR